MMKLHNDGCLLVLACLCCTVLGKNAQAQANRLLPRDSSIPCSYATDRSREAPRPCTLVESRSTRRVPISATDGVPSTAVDRKDTHQGADHNGHFDAAGRTGLIPFRRMSWREVGSWRELHRARGH